MLLVLALSAVVFGQCNLNGAVGFYPLKCDANGNIVSPWSSLETAVNAEMEWYQKSPPASHGYPTFIYATFVDGNYIPIPRKIGQIIPAMQDGMGIISYLKYWEYRNRTDDRFLRTARLMGQYLVDEAGVTAKGVYSGFTRSTGNYTAWPLNASTQGDAEFGPNTIEPDKGGIAGYALLLLYRATREPSFLAQAMRNARILAQQQLEGDAKSAPWPFRVNAVTGAAVNGARNGNMAYILRLFMGLAEEGVEEFRMPAERLWRWIVTYQIPSPPTRNESLFVNFFEDHVDTGTGNRCSWPILEMARLLIEQRERLDRDWLRHSEDLVAFAIDILSQKVYGNTTIMTEQDEDMHGWGGANSKLGGVTAMLACAGGPQYYHRMSQNNLAWLSYYIDRDGCSSDTAWHTDPPDTTIRGGWQEDAHTDVIHNFVDAFNAYRGVCRR